MFHQSAFNCGLCYGQEVDFGGPMGVPQRYRWSISLGHIYNQYNVYYVLYIYIYNQYNIYYV